MPSDKILVYHDYLDEPFPRLIGARRDYHSWLGRMYELFQGKQIPNIPAKRKTSVRAFVSAGRWVWQCLGCNSAIPAEDGSKLASHYGHPSLCPECDSQGWVDVKFPRNRRRIEEELLKQPGHRSNAPIRDWNLEWKLENLQQRTMKAQAMLASGLPVRALSVANTKMWGVGEILTAANMNSHVTNPIDDLVGRAGSNPGGGGPVEFENAIVIDSLTTTERDALTAVDGMVIYNTTLNVFQRYENGVWVSYTDLAAMTIASAAQGDLLYINSSGNVARLPASTDGHVLTTNGTNADPIWASASSPITYVGIDTTTAGTTRTGSWTKPSGMVGCYVVAIGGGGGGKGGGTATGDGQGGEGGHWAARLFRAGDLGSSSSVAYTIGARGAADNDGVDTRFYGELVGRGGYQGYKNSRIPHDGRSRPGNQGPSGGNGGGVGSAGSAGFDGSISSGGVQGGTGGAAGSSAAVNGAAGGNSGYFSTGFGGGGGGGGGAFTSSNGNGGNGGNGARAGAGGGGGGAGAGTGSHGSGGTGGDGRLMIWWW